MRATFLKFIFSISISLFLFSTGAFSQVDKYKSHAISTKTEGDDEYSDWEETTVLITIDMDQQRIKIYSKVPQVYDVVSFDEAYEDEDGDTVFNMYCVDDEGIECRLRLISRTSGNAELYCDYSDLSWVYSIYSVD
ncbi:MAG: hypothetical protein ACK45H_09890 [Bacteroidota bacterium]|jgi:hypothetical protein